MRRGEQVRSRRAGHSDIVVCRTCGTKVCDLEGCRFVVYGMSQGLVMLPHQAFASSCLFRKATQSQKERKPFKVGEMMCELCEGDLGNMQNNVAVPRMSGKIVCLLKHASIEFHLGGSLRCTVENANHLRRAMGHLDGSIGEWTLSPQDIIHAACGVESLSRYENIQKVLRVRELFSRSSPSRRFSLEALDMPLVSPRTDDERDGGSPTSPISPPVSEEEGAFAFPVKIRLKHAGEPTAELAHKMHVSGLGDLERRCVAMAGESRDRLTLTYVDAEQETICVETEQDLEEALIDAAGRDATLSLTVGCPGPKLSPN